MKKKYLSLFIIPLIVFIYILYLRNENIKDRTVKIDKESRIDTLIVYDATFSKPNFKINDSVFFMFENTTVHSGTIFINERGDTIKIRDFEYPYKFWKPEGVNALYILKKEQLYWSKF